MMAIQSEGGGGNAVEQQVQRRNEMQAQLVERASRDQAFRQELLADPRAVIEREFGLAVPEGVQVRVVEETPTTAYLVLPPALARPGQELSDQELEAVAGGWSEAEASCNTCGSCGQPTVCEFSCAN